MASSVSNFAVRTLNSSVGASAVAFVVYLLVALGFNARGLGQSAFPYFVYLADAFLRGQLALASIPPQLYDLVQFQGKVYLYWPPFPAVVLMPVVALWGLGASDTLINLLIGSANVGLVSLMLSELTRQHIAVLSRVQRAWMTVFFAFGTVYFTLVPFGNVWFGSQVVGLTVTLAAHIVALRFSNWQWMLVAGVFAGLAFLTRNPLILSFVWLAWFCLKRAWPRGRTHVLAVSLSAAGPVVLSILLYGWYNYARFGNPLDIGYAYHNMAGLFRSDYQHYGAFSLHYLPINLYYYLLAIPYLSLYGENPATDFWMGGSMFLMSPLYLAALWGMFREWKGDGWALSLSCLMGLAPALLLMGTGWMQFGPRYTLDIAAPMLVATAIGVKHLPPKWLSRFVVFSVAMYLPGVLLFGQAAVNR